LVMQFSPPPRHSILFRPKYSPQHPILNHPQLILHGSKSQKTSLIHTALKACQKTVFFELEY
jgi:hypothetical protein